MGSHCLSEGCLQTAVAHTGLGDVKGHVMVPGPPLPTPLEGTPIQYPLGKAAPCPGKSRCVPVGPLVTHVSRNPSLPQSPLPSPTTHPPHPAEPCGAHEPGPGVPTYPVSHPWALPCALSFSTSQGSTRCGPESSAQHVLSRCRFRLSSAWSPGDVHVFFSEQFPPPWPRDTPAHSQEPVGRRGWTRA